MAEDIPGIWESLFPSGCLGFSHLEGREMVNENSKTELKRLCTMNPLEMAERLHKAEQDVKVAKGQYEGALVIIKKLEADVADLDSIMDDHNRVVNELHNSTKTLQAKIDALMLEYCPDEMTPEQLANWGANQRPVSPEVQTEIDKTTKGE